MVKRFKKEKHALYLMNYSLTQSTNYGEKFLNKEEYIESLKNVISNINKTFEVKEINLECGQNYFTLIFSTKPEIKIPLFINAIKTHTSRELRKRFPILRMLKDKIWSPNYFITTTGNTTMEDRQDYINSQLTKNREVLIQKHEKKLRAPSIA